MKPRTPQWLFRYADAQLRSIIVLQSVAIYNAEKKAQEWQRIAEKHAEDLRRIATPTDGTTVGAAAICTGIAAPAVWVCSLWGNGLFGR